MNKSSVSGIKDTKIGGYLDTVIDLRLSEQVTHSSLYSSARSSPISFTAPSSTLTSPTATSTAMVNIASDKTFDARFQSIIERWSTNYLTQVDRTYLFATTVTVNEFIELTEQFNLRHGIELIDYHLKLTEWPGEICEFFSRIFDTWVRNA